METVKDRRTWIDVLYIMRANECHPRLLYPEKLAITIDGENKIFNFKARFTQNVSTTPALQNDQEGKLQPKVFNCTHKDVGKRYSQFTIPSPKKKWGKYTHNSSAENKYKTKKN